MPANPDSQSQRKLHFRIPHIFIGGANESRYITSAIKDSLHSKDGWRTASSWNDTDIWSYGRESTLSNLLQMASRFSFAIFVFEGVDVSIVRGVSKKSVRDNVLFEFGLFMTALGPERTIAVIENGLDVHIMSDIDGVVKIYADFNSGDMSHAISKVIKTIEGAVRVPCNGVIHHPPIAIRGKVTTTNAHQIPHYTSLLMRDKLIDYLDSASLPDHIAYYGARGANAYVKQKEMERRGKFSAPSLCPDGIIRKVMESIDVNQSGPFGKCLNICVLGCGDGISERRFIDSIASTNVKINVLLFDCNETLLRLAHGEIRGNPSVSSILTIQMDFISEMSLIGDILSHYSASGNTLFISIGNTISNLRISEVEFIRNISGLMLHGDMLYVDMNYISDPLPDNHLGKWRCDNKNRWEREDENTAVDGYVLDEFEMQLKAISQEVILHRKRGFIENIKRPLRMKVRNALTECASAGSEVVYETSDEGVSVFSIRMHGKDYITKRILSNMELADKSILYHLYSDEMGTGSEIGQKNLHILFSCGPKPKGGQNENMANLAM